uniref:tetratricopeptide repeat protein n=1 Tax=Falsiroseomonas oryzae TaxID=2766473 RepID=UPI0022EB5332
MRPLLLAASAALILSGCATQQQATTSPDAARHLRVAAAAERSGQPEMALNMYAAAFEAHPADPEVVSRFTAALVQNGQPQRARDVLAEARRRNPGNAALTQAEARTLLELGEAERALQLFDAHLRLAPRDVRSLNGRGIALDLLGRHAEARMAYRAARAADPDNAAAAGNLALSLVLSGCADAAVAVLEAAPRSGATAAWLGQVQGFARTVSPASGDPQGAML